jgi:hypothetical protein
MDMSAPPLPAIPQDEGPALPGPTQAPRPTGQYAGWFPAMIDVPGLTRITRARCYVTPDGLYLWRRAPEAATEQAQAETPDLWLPIRWDLTGPIPRSGVARVQGVYLSTEYGIVHVTPQGGCGCGSRLKRWAPSWASHSLAGWPGEATTTTAVPEPEFEDADAEPATDAGEVGDPDVAPSTTRNSGARGAARK